WKFAAFHLAEFGGEVGELLAEVRVQGLPLGEEIGAALANAVAEVVENPVWNKKLGVFGPAVVFLDELHFGFAERFAVGFGSVLLVGRAVTDVAVDDDKRGAVGRALKRGESEIQKIEVVGVGHAKDIPLIPLETRHDLFAEGPGGGTVEGDVI